MGTMKVDRAAKSAAYAAARKAAEAAGYVSPIAVNAAGYWKALGPWCREHGIVFPSRQAKGSAPKAKVPTAAELAAAKREATLARKREAEKARRLRIKAAKAGRK